MAEAALSAGPALAHSFNVALVIPLSEETSDQGRQIQDGFMLATKERDSHPGEVSDGHLGGLDVYVTVIDGNADPSADIARAAAEGKAEIWAAFGPDSTLSLVMKALDGKPVALLLPGQTPFSRSDLPGTAAFVAAYEKEYGHEPTGHAAQGYNAARRIDVAVRAQEGVDDIESLRRSFRETARGFEW